MTEIVSRRISIHEAIGENKRTTCVRLIGGTAIDAKEVILSAGLRSPQLLQLSGIGDPEELKDAGIEPRDDMLDVGKGLSDHLSFFQHWRSLTFRQSIY
ncbi:unnamed protein product [Clonostachys solani]|uniref:Glucose-methanol-choline oxidoreductase N-terminal domain-containing protein n=1 Tax=Clonostachys solani TaxID=160281 RepID=A0A9N9YYZ5_9HYPO|nr:unnamed protein product [Clonostachys solani]